MNSVSLCFISIISVFLHIWWSRPGHLSSHMTFVTHPLCFLYVILSLFFFLSDLLFFPVEHEPYSWDSLIITYFMQLSVVSFLCPIARNNFCSWNFPCTLLFSILCHWPLYNSYCYLCITYLLQWILNIIKTALPALFV